MSKSFGPAGVPGMIAAARGSSRSSTGGLPSFARLSVSSARSLGRNSAATALCTSSTSSALQTLGRLVFAFSTIFRAFCMSAAAST